MNAESEWQARLRSNVAHVRQVVAAACARVGRPAAEVTLVGVTKYVSVDVIRALVAVGVTDIGESRVQQLAARAAECGAARLDWPDLAAGGGGGPRWHMIGHLQRNKIKALLPHARILHSVDSERLAASVAEHAAALGVSVDAFVEVNMSGEDSKEGVAPDDVAALLGAMEKFAALRVRGLMTMAPYNEDPEASRPHFARMRALLDRLRSSGDAGPDCVHLSMGMSQDYGVAVEEGATFIRVGAALFAGLATTDPRG